MAYYETPSEAPQRSLRVYAFDPSRGARLDNVLTIRVPNEPLERGPVGAKIAVIDYDASNHCYYEPVDLDAKNALGQQGLAPSESNPKFHQQMVYAVIMETIRRFETAIGREVRWYPENTSKDLPLHGRLRVYPHAMQEANAFYDRDQHALLFGYFKASEEEAGMNLPGQIVFTCLSHDIVVHETTHAILDGIRSHFNDPTGQDAAAFHEGFAD
ncbi:MAG TPA: peptidase M4, partial [Thermoanaerobaculia bacterium]